MANFKLTVNGKYFFKLVLQESVESVKLWVEVISLLAVAAIGLCCNIVSIPVLLSRRMRNLFNRTLAVLAVFDILYLLLEMLVRGGNRKPVSFDSFLLSLPALFRLVFLVTLLQHFFGCNLCNNSQCKMLNAWLQI